MSTSSAADWTDAARRARRLALALGAAIAVTGVAVLTWPGATVVVLGFWLGLAMILYGVKELVDAATGTAGSRTLALVVGGVSLVAGLVVVFAPMLTAVTIGTLIGIAWLADGVFAIVAAFVEGTHRIVRVAVGVLSLIAGGIVILQPALSLVAITWFAGVWMLVVGLVIVGLALLRRPEAGAPSV